MKTGEINNGTSVAKTIGVVACTLILIMSSCKKDQIAKNDDPIISPTTGTRAQFTLDSIFLYAKQIYLWNDILPSYSDFNPRIKYASYSPDLLGFQTELFDISELKINPATGSPYEMPVLSGKAKYSFLESSSVVTSGSVAAVDVASSDNDPVLATAVLKAGDLNVGYIALSSFPALSVAQPYIDAAFSTITSVSLSDLVIDLRSNGGGYIETASYVSDLVIPSTVNGKVAYVERFNSQMQSGNATILKHQPYLDNNGNSVVYLGRPATMADVDYSVAGNTFSFTKKGGLQNIKNVYFIVSDRTASASELLINCLKPYLNVKLIGSTTYGKPVGFIGINIDTYAVYMSNFLITNALGNADYFNGMSVDIPVTPDGLHELGDPQETCLKATLAYIQTGKIPASSQVIQTGIKAASIAKLAAPSNSASVMIENRLKLKIHN